MRFLSALAVSVAVALGLWMTSALPIAAANPLTITTLSSRPEMVSGGDALIEIRHASGMPANVAVKVNDRDATSAFHSNAERQSLIGLAEGLRVGHNTIQRLPLTAAPVSTPTSAWRP